MLDLGADIGQRITTVRGVELVDVLYPTGGVRGSLFTNRQRVVLDDHPAWIPTLAAMLAMKWLAMFSPSRGGRKQIQDKADFVQMIEVHPTVDIRAVARLVAKTSPLLGKQLIYDMTEYKKSGDVRLFGGSDL